MRGSANKSPIKLSMQRKINWHGDLFTNRENLHVKTPPGDFKVTTPENLLLLKQEVTSKGIPVPYTNLQLNPYSNTQLDLFYSDNLSFQCTAPSTWLTNCADPSTQLIHQPEKNVGCKVLQFITRWRSKSSLVTKPHGVQTQQFLQEKDELGHMSLVHNMLVKNFCIELHQLWRPLKQSLYMFKVMRKERLNTYSQIGWKTALKNWVS